MVLDTLNLHTPETISSGLVPVLYADFERRSTGVFGALVGIDGWVEFGVVIHLHLPVKLEPAAACEDVAPKNVQAGSKIGPLFLDQAEAEEILLAMSL